MRKIIIAFALLFNLNSLALAADNYNATAGSGLTFAAKDATGVLYSRFIGCDNTTVSQCWAVDASGRLTVNLAASSTITVTQATAANLNATVVGTGTFAVQAAQSGTWTVQPGNTANTTPWLVTGSGTAGSAATGVLSVQGIASMTPLFIQSGTVPVSTMNSASANSGINTAMAAVFDDVSPTAITENSFGFVRMSANRNQYTTIRDAAGNERGVNVDSSNRLTTAPTMVSGSVASGAFASGSIASGAIASGAIAAGAQVDLLTMRQTVAAGTAASNSLLTGGQYNSTPITLTNTQGSALQLDANGYLKVNTAAGAAAGGTSSNFGSAFPTPGTAIGFTNGTNMTAASVGAVANVAAATNFVNSLGIAQYNATPLTVTDTRYQSLQSDVNGFLKVNVTNTNANGQATMANSSPVVIASNQSAVPVSVASGGIASGAIASGAVASGAYASGAVSSGAYASGSLASGAVVDITNMSVATGAAPPSKAIYLGANTSGATGGLLQGLIQCDSTAIYDASTNGSTELVALTSGRTIYVCGYTIMAGGTVNVKLIYGTGTACATGSNNMTPAYQLTAQAGVSDQSPFSRGLKTASANALCINTSAGVAAQAIVYYAKL